MAPLGMDVIGILQTCPIHLHLQRLMPREMSVLLYLVQNFVGPVDLLLYGYSHLGGGYYLR